MPHSSQIGSAGKRLFSWIDRWLPASIAGDPFLARKGRLLLWMCVLVIGACGGYIPFYVWLQFWPGVFICAYGGLSALGLMVFFNKTGNLPVAGNFFTFTSLIFFSAFGMAMHGLETNVSAWIAIVPLTAYLLANARSGAIWMVISLGWVLLFYFLGDTGKYMPQLVEKTAIPMVNMASLLGFLLFVGLVAWYFENGRRKAEAGLKLAKTEIEVQKNLLEMQNAQISAINQNLETLVKDKTRDLDEKNEELDIFLYQSSHALRRPLARASGLVNLLKPGISKQEMEFIRSKTELTYVEMDKMLRKLMVISEVFQRKLQLEPFDLKDWLGIYLAQFCQAKGIPEGQIPWSVEGNSTAKTDLKLLTVAMDEILTNSIIYTKVEGQLPEVELKVSGSAETFEIQVSDKGMGIQEAFMPQVFKLFSRGTVRGNGNGLGLYLARNAVQKLGGKIQVEPVSGIGTKVTLLLPTFFSGSPNNTGQRSY